MSMITEQIKRMRRLADEMEKSTFVHEATHFIAIKVLREATDTIEQLAAKVRKENGFIFHENPTNGDMLQALFPNVKWWVNEDNEVFTDHKTINSNRVAINADWWNSPYEKGEMNG